MVQQLPKTDIVYPDGDGQPMSDNTLQFQWIVNIKENLEAIYANDPNVFVAGDLLWYPVEGSNSIRQAPDAMIAFGRPKGDRSSYMQWKEGDIAPQVVFEFSHRAIVAVNWLKNFSSINAMAFKNTTFTILTM
ncbi:MAG: hypothetical protein ACR2FS_05895 [Phormidesmis sp.]